MLVRSVEVGLDADWGLDHGCWSVLKQMFPEADIPVVQFSLDYTQPGLYHYQPGQRTCAPARPGCAHFGQRQHGAQPAARCHPWQ